MCLGMVNATWNATILTASLMVLIVRKTFNVAMNTMTLTA